MRIENCETRFDAVSMAPIQFRDAQPDWVEARETGVVPASLFSLYRRANFLSVGGQPRFLSDKKLFGYFSLSVRGIKQCLADADEEFDAFLDANGRVFDYGKQRRGEPWDSKAPRQAQRQLRAMLLSLFAGLDCVAELAAILLTNQIKKLQVGKAKFQRIEEWLRLPRPTVGQIATPQQVKALDLYDRLHPLANPSGEQSDWLSLGRLIRDKAAHLGTEQFREIGLPDSKGVFYTFLPRCWPVLWEEHIETDGRSDESNRAPIEHYLDSSFMKQDKVAYIRGLRANVTLLIDTAVSILDSAYRDFKDFDLNRSALDQLERSTQTFHFAAFPE